MLSNCPKSCKTCDITNAEELQQLIAWKKALLDVDGDETLLETPYGKTQTMEPSNADKIQEVIRNFTSYMDQVIFTVPQYETVKTTCKNRESRCAEWASLGECDAVRS